jgi:hypothetical protein
MKFLVDMAIAFGAGLGVAGIGVVVCYALAGWGLGFVALPVGGFFVLSAAITTVIVAKWRA